jgi:hypothetical protein
MVGVFASEDLSEAQAMIGYVTLLLSCQLLGEAVVALVRVPVPGRVWRCCSVGFASMAKFPTDLRA